MKILVFGGHGQAGTEFLRICEQHAIPIEAPSKSEVNVCALKPLRSAIEQSDADLLVNLTAFHELEECEREFLEALAINAASVREMALVSLKAGIRFITVSTDYVFDGRSTVPYKEEDAAFPLQAYGLSKRIGELAALSINPGTTCVVRTCGLYGSAGSRSRGGNFVERRLQDFSGKSAIEVGSDLRCTPTSASAFAKALLALAMKQEASGGVYHLTCEGDCSWAEFTQEIGRVVQTKCKVIPVDRHGNYGSVKRPAYSVLANVRAADVGIRLPHWRNALSAYLRNREANK